MKKKKKWMETALSAISWRKLSPPDTFGDVKHRQTHYFHLWKTPPQWKTFL